MIVINIKFKDETVHQLLIGGVKETKIRSKRACMQINRFNKIDQTDREYPPTKNYYTWQKVMKQKESGPHIHILFYPIPSNPKQPVFSMGFVVMNFTGL